MLTSTTAVNLQITRSLVIGIPNPIQLLADKVTERRLFAATRQDAIGTHATCRDEALRSACGGNPDICQTSPKRSSGAFTRLAYRP
jgi:hypothetical protein